MAAAASKTLTGILLMVGFCIFGPAIDVFAKLAGNSGIPVFQISASRFAFQGLFLLPFALYLTPANRSSGGCSQISEPQSWAMNYSSIMNIITFLSVQPPSRVT